MMKIKIISILLIVVLINITPVNALEKITSDASGFVQKGEAQDDVIDQEAMQTASSTIYSMLLTVGIVLVVAVGGVLGIKFMLGSIEEQAKIKEALIPYIIGCVVIFAGFGIWKIVINIGNDIESQGPSQFEDYKMNSM